MRGGSWGDRAIRGMLQQKAFQRGCYLLLHLRYLPLHRVNLPAPVLELLAHRLQLLLIGSKLNTLRLDLVPVAFQHLREAGRGKGGRGSDGGFNKT